ncbi:Rha family transcriptional regulator [Clostridium sp. HMP27]|uniref:Rha family transcriptional regulator n=1 Tax=Clostridium sp. HMP27 TaxID=1487921 RepID=UPI0005567B89
MLKIIADFFEKEHKNVLCDIAKITEPRSGLSKEFTRLNFEQSYYLLVDEQHHLEWYMAKLKQKSI